VLVRNRNQNLLGKVVIVLNGRHMTTCGFYSRQSGGVAQAPPGTLSWRLGLAALANAVRGRITELTEGTKCRSRGVARPERCGARTADLSAGDLGGDLRTNQADRTPVLASEDFQLDRLAGSVLPDRLL
jgi:hypothetical protein